MPSVRHVATKAAIPTHSPKADPAQQPFRFPEDNHLLITTPRHVFAWDASGVRSVFHSSKAGIVAARGAKDGSGVLAVAGRNVVVLHDSKRGGKEESWGLNAPQDQVRHLEYSNDAKSLFLSTTTHGTIQHYSTEASRLLDPAQTHASSPVALALSSTGHILLSASHDPPAVHLKNLAHNTASSLLQPNASAAPVSCATFHPERPNVFALAFRDGTVAAYDASKMTRKRDDLKATRASAGDGEISHLSRLHRCVVAGDETLAQSNTASPIVDMAFLPGFKTRAVTAGYDGRCRIIDFSNRGVVLRTWHTKAPLTSVSVLAVRLSAERASQSSVTHRRQRSRPSGGHTIGGPTSTSSIIAVGRIDGKVQLYDTLGLLIAQKKISAQEEKILSMEWVKGPSPRTTLEGNDLGHFSDAPSTALEPRVVQRSATSMQSPSTPGLLTSTPSVACDSNVPSNIPSPHNGAPLGSARQFAVHPDELQEDTVRYVPSPNGARPAIPIGGGAYHDLFSPIKGDVQATRDPPQKLFSSPPRSRPRISSQTFVKNPDAAIEVKSIGLSKSLLTVPASIHTQANDLDSCRMERPRPMTHLCRVDRQVSPLSKAKSKTRLRPTFANDDMARGIDKINENAKVLADLRKLANSSLRRESGILSGYRTSPPAGRAGNIEERDWSIQRNKAARWNTIEPADAMAAHSTGVKIEEQNIWLTSESEGDCHLQRRTRLKRPLTRPPGRQTSRSRVDSKGTISTTAARFQSSPTSDLRRLDGSTEEDMVTAHSCVSPIEEFHPASEDVREMFPRSSSLTPHQESSPKKQRSSTRRDRTLTTIAVNSAFGRQQPPKSPWARVKAAKPASNRNPGLLPSTGKAVRKNQYVTVLEAESAENRPPESTGLVRSPSFSCLACPEAKARMRDLEGEVAQLKGEVRALKAALRRNDLPLPACLR